MEYYLYQNDIFLPLGGKTKQSPSMKDGEWEVLHKKTLGNIILCLATSVAFNISKEKIMEDMMKALTKLYEKP
jgi:hypothetical protein